MGDKNVGDDSREIAVDSDSNSTEIVTTSDKTIIAPLKWLMKIPAFAHVFYTTIRDMKNISQFSSMLTSNPQLVLEVYTKLREENPEANFALMNIGLLGKVAFVLKPEISKNIELGKYEGIVMGSTFEIPDIFFQGETIFAAHQDSVMWKKLHEDIGKQISDKKSLENHALVMFEETESAIESMPINTPINILDHMKIFTLKVILKSLFETLIFADEKELEIFRTEFPDRDNVLMTAEQSLKIAASISDGLNLVSYMNLLGLNPMNIPIIAGLVKKNQNVVDTWVDEIIDLHKKENYTEDGVGIDLIAKFLKNKYSEGNTRANSGVIILAGYDTSASVLSWLNYYMASDGQIQADLDNWFMNQEGAALNLDNVMASTTIEKIIKETLRVRGPIALGFRGTNENGATIEGQYIEPKTLLGLMHDGYHNDPEYWENPGEYNADQHFEVKGGKVVPKGKDGKVPPFMPFGYGPKICSGMGFALQEMQIFVAKLVEWMHKNDLVIQQVDKDGNPTDVMPKSVAHGGVRTPEEFFIKFVPRT